jgi:hypothetical protein
VFSGWRAQRWGFSDVNVGMAEKQIRLVLVQKLEHAVPGLCEIRVVEDVRHGVARLDERITLNDRTQRDDIRLFQSDGILNPIQSLVILHFVGIHFFPPKT